MSDRKEQYRVFCREEAELPIFFQDWWLDTVCVDGEWDVALHEEANQLAGVYPYFRKKRFGFQYLAMPQFTKYLGPWIRPAFRQTKKEYTILEGLIGQLPRVDCIKQNCYYSLQNWLPFYWRDFQQSTRYSYRLYLEDIAALEQNMNRNMRRNIRKADKVVHLQKEADPEQFYRINQLSFERQGLAMPYSLQDFMRQDQALARRRARQIFLARDAQGNIHAAAYLIWDNTAAYYHLSGDDPHYRDSGAGIWLIWQAIQYTAEALGLPAFDFEGSMLPRVERIRRQFGATPTPYFSIYKYNSRLYYLLDWLQGQANTT